MGTRRARISANLNPRTRFVVPESAACLARRYQGGNKFPPSPLPVDVELVRVVLPDHPIIFVYTGAESYDVEHQRVHNPAQFLTNDLHFLVVETTG